MIRIFLASLVIIATVFLVPTRVACASCGVTPIKPIPPVGCRDLTPVCVTNGSSAYWTWVCVK